LGSWYPTLETEESREDGAREFSERTSLTSLESRGLDDNDWRQAARSKR